MPLRLQVTSAHREYMGGSYLQEFAACGGIIGRSLECDWPLPDSKRYVSSRHAMIDFNNGAYYLVDLSRNGVFVNGSTTPVGKGNPQRLFDGDTFRLGDFEIAVELVEDALDAGDGMRDSVVRAQMVQEDESVEMAMLPPHQITDEFELDELLEPSDESGELSALSEQPAAIAALLENSQKQLTDATDEFLRAAGLNPDDFRGIDALALLKNAAKLLAEYTEGTHALLVSKDKIMAGMNVRKAAKTTNPLRASDGCDNALRLMLGRNNDVNKSGALAIEAAFDELLLHQRAVISAMRNAINETTDEHRQPGPFDDEFVKAYVLETTD